MNEQKTLAIVISSLRMGGAEKVASLVANHFAQQYKILLCLWNDEERFYPLNPNVQIQIIATKRRGILGNLERILKLWKIFKAHKVNLSISFIHQTNILTILASKIAGIPCIATEHSIFSALDSKLWRLGRTLTYPLADCVTTLTQQDLEHYRFLKNVCVLPNPVEIDCNPCIPPFLESYQPYILSAGRMIASKGFDELIESFRIFSAQFPQYTLLLAGDGIQRETLQAQAEGLKCKFLGKIESLAPYYAKAEFFALASHREALSNVLIESLLCGTPVVSYDCPYGPKEILTCDSAQHNGILVEMDEKRVESLATAFVAMAQNREGYAKNTALAQKRFSSQVVLEKWQQLIFDCLNTTPT